MSLSEVSTKVEQTERVIETTPSMTSLAQPEAERRQITVMFCDLTVSAPDTGKIDPEDLREVVREYQAVCTEVIDRHEGHIAQYLDNGILVYFGYPTAHEYDALHAVQAGLGIIEGIDAINDRLSQEYGMGTTVRAGIHTGLVVVGEMGGTTHHEQLALGETPNIAARVEARAEQNTVAITEATFRLIQGSVVCQSLGSETLKGVAQSIQLYRVLEEVNEVVATSSDLTPLIGREVEMILLLERWEAVLEGRGQVVLISGEAGIGKSRLALAMRHISTLESAVRFECRCSSYHQNSNLYPLIDMLQRTTGIRSDDTADEQLDKLKAWLLPHESTLPDALPLFADFLGIPLPLSHSSQSFSPDTQRGKTLELLLALLLDKAVDHPVLFIVEDIHWADPSTLEFLNLLVEQGPTARILTLLTFRTGFSSPWIDYDYLTLLSLHRLTRGQVGAMILKLTGEKTLPSVVEDQILDKTDGIPVFVEELTKMVMESGILEENEDRYDLTGPLPPLAIPSTLYDSLMARIDRLARAKDIIQIGATIGRSFSFDMIHAVSGVDPEILQQELDRLLKAELVFQRGVPPQSIYIFKHSMIQDVAYESLLRSTRQQYHLKIAQELECRFPETSDTQPEILAQHYSNAGLFEQAVGYWRKASSRSMQRSAANEAMAHLQSGLEALHNLPDSEERSRLELEMQIALGPMVMSTFGQASPEVERVYDRARILARQLDAGDRLFPILWGLWRFYLNRAELATARETADQLFEITQPSADVGLTMEAHMAMGTTLFMQGEFAAAHPHVEGAMFLYDKEQHHSLAHLYGGCDPGVYCFAYKMFNLWPLGFPDQAHQASADGIALAKELDHIPSQSAILAFSICYLMFQREIDKVKTLSEELITLAEEHNYGFWMAVSRIYHGWAVGCTGNVEDGIEEMRQGLSDYTDTSEELLKPFFMTHLGELYGKAGMASEALAVAAEALAVIHSTGERWWEADVIRLKGDLMVDRDEAEAEANYTQAMAIAKQQDAKSLELRSTTGLAKLWDKQGKHEDAVALLKTSFECFTEGFDTPDLQAAQTFLESSDVRETV